VDLTKYKFGKDIKDTLAIGATCKKLHESVRTSALERKFTLVLGGDHSLATGSISGMKSVYPDLKVVWIDAHADANLPEQPPFRVNYHGMPVSHLMGWIPEKSIPGFDWLNPSLKPNDIAYIGLRDLDADEKHKLPQENIKAFHMDAVTEIGIGAVLNQILEYFHTDGKDHPIHISFDIDAIDPMYATHTGTKARGGLTYREAHYIMRRLAKTNCIVSMDMVEINPMILGGLPKREHVFGDNQLVSGPETVCLGVELIESALGRKLL